MSRERIERALQELRTAKREYAAMGAATARYDQGVHQGTAEVHMHRAEAALADELASADQPQEPSARQRQHGRGPWSAQTQEA